MVNRDRPGNHQTLRARVGRGLRGLRGTAPSHRQGGSRGQGMVEFALILPLLLLLMMGIIEFGYVFTVYTGIFNAAREGARYGVVHPAPPNPIRFRVLEKVFLVVSSQ